MGKADFMRAYIVRICGWRTMKKYVMMEDKTLSDVSTTYIVDARG